MWEFILNQIPWWVYVILIVAAGGILWVYFGPLILAIWRILPGWVKYVIGLLLAIGLAVVYGRNKGWNDRESVQRRIDEKAVENRRVVHESVQKRSEPELDRDLAKWMRD